MNYLNHNMKSGNCQEISGSFRFFSEIPDSALIFQKQSAIMNNVSSFTSFLAGGIKYDDKDRKIF